MCEEHGPEIQISGLCTVLVYGPTEIMLSELNKNMVFGSFGFGAGAMAGS